MAEVICRTGKTDFYGEKAKKTRKHRGIPRAYGSGNSPKQFGGGSRRFAVGHWHTAPSWSDQRIPTRYCGVVRGHAVYNTQD